MWGLVTLGGTIYIVFLECYLNGTDDRDLIPESIIELSYEQGIGFYFQHGNARPHTSRKVRTYLKNGGVPVYLRLNSCQLTPPML